MTPSIVHRYFDQIYVLNLERRPDKKGEMVKKLNTLGINATFITAVDGYTLENKREYETYVQLPLKAEGCHPLELLRNRKLISSPGAWGCLKSYLKIIQLAKKNGFKKILCLEDDAVFHKDFEQKFTEAIQTIPSSWKVLYLGASQREWQIPRDLSYANPDKTTFDPNEDWYYPKRTDGTYAFALDASTFDLLISEIKKMDCPIDSGPLRSIFHAHPKECFVVFPNLIIADVTTSDIRTGRDQKEISARMKWNLEDYDFQFQSFID